jgi:hypothetical protein
MTKFEKKHIIGEELMIENKLRKVNIFSIELND